jgi:hypothetical protein
MQLAIVLAFNLETGKRTRRQAFCFDPMTKEIIGSELPRQLLLPTRLPQEWLPAALRTGMSGPVASWIDRSLFDVEESGDPDQVA